MALIYARTAPADITAGLKLSYDHPVFSGTLRFMRCQSCCQLCQTFCTSSLSSSMSMSLFMLLTSSSPVMVT